MLTAMPVDQTRGPGNASDPGGKRKFDVGLREETEQLFLSSIL